MIATVLAFTGGAIASAAVYKIISIVKECRRNKESLVAEIDRLRTRIYCMEISIKHLNECNGNSEKHLSKLHELESNAKVD
ncbi:hypothetical protein P4358_26480 [Bacillus thuringiensis]|nr:hypothetical protein [Bacillus thuringiensis]